MHAKKRRRREPPQARRMGANAAELSACQRVRSATGVFPKEGFPGGFLEWHSWLAGNSVGGKVPKGFGFQGGLCRNDNALIIFHSWGKAWCIERKQRRLKDSFSNFPSPSWARATSS